MTEINRLPGSKVTRVIAPRASRRIVAIQRLEIANGCGLC